MTKYTIDVANYILDDDKEYIDFKENLSNNHIYFKALNLIYDIDQIKFDVLPAYGLTREEIETLIKGG